MKAITISGDKKVIDALQKLGRTAQARIVRPALAEIEAGLVPDLQAASPTGRTGKLKRSWIGKIVGSVLQIEAAWYWKFVEFGTSPHALKAFGKADIVHPGAKKGRFVQRVMKRWQRPGGRIEKAFSRVINGLKI